jgi:hypothetical protein
LSKFKTIKGAHGRMSLGDKQRNKREKEEKSREKKLKIIFLNKVKEMDDKVR